MIRRNIWIWWWLMQKVDNNGLELGRAGGGQYHNGVKIILKLNLNLNASWNLTIYLNNLFHLHFQLIWWNSREYLVKLTYTLELNCRYIMSVSKQHLENLIIWAFWELNIRGLLNLFKGTFVSDLGHWHYVQTLGIAFELNIFAPHWGGGTSESCAIR